NPDSLDASIQSLLFVLYPPFEATASTVLGQLFQVIEGCYHGDPLQCFTDFLIPARHLPETVQLVHDKPLSHCLLATEQGVVKVPWDQVASPEFVDESQRMACPGPADQQESSSGHYLRDSPVPPGYLVETRIRPAKDGIAVSLCLVDSSSQSGMEPDGPGMPVGWVSPNTWDSRSKNCFRGQYLEHVDVTKEKEVVVCSRTQGQPRTPVLKPHGLTTSAGSGSSFHGHRPCGRTVRFAEQPCTPCMRRKHNQGSQGQECRYKEFYMETQQSPAIVEKSPQESVPSGRSISEDLMGIREGTITCLVPNVVGTSEKCHVVVQGQPSEGSRDGYLETLPRLHVVPGKKTTAFGLVSPKLNRRRTKPNGCFSEDDPQDPKTFSPLANGSWRDGPKSTETHTAGMEQVIPTGPAAPPAAFKPETCLLHLGVACLTGGRDRSSRPVVEVYGDHTHWESPLVSTLQLSTLLLYFNTITRKVQEVGLTVVYDARNKAPHPAFTEALQMVQVGVPNLLQHDKESPEKDPRAVHCVLLLQSKGYSHEKDSGRMKTNKKHSLLFMQDIVASLKALHKCIERSQLTSALGGSFSYSHRDWLDLHRELHPFVLDLKEARDLLLEAIRNLEGIHKIDTVQDVEQCISEQRALMKDALQDPRLVALQREGSAMLARLRWECNVRAAHCEETCEVMETVEGLYNQVEEQVHVLARRSSVSLQHLNLLLQLREMESRFTKIKEWFDVEGDRQLLEAESVEVSSGRIQETLQGFSTFLSEANEQKLKAMMLLNEAERIQGPNYPETEAFQTMVSTFKSSLSDFLSRAEQCCDELQDMVNLCHFCERATEVAEACSQQLDQIPLQCMAQEEKWATLQQCHQKLIEFSHERFQDAKALAGSLQSCRGMQVWNMAWLRCQDISQQLEESLQDLEQAQHRLVHLTYEQHGDGGEASTFEAEHLHGAPALPQSNIQRSMPEQCEVKHNRDRESIYGTVTCFNFRQSRKGRKGSRTVAAADQGLADYGKNTSRKTSHDGRQRVIEGSTTAGCQWFPWKSTLSRSRGENSASSSFKTSPSNYMESNSLTPLISDVQVLEAANCGTQTTLPASVPTYSNTQSAVPICIGAKTPVPTCSETQEPLSANCQAQPCERHNSHTGRFYSEESSCEVELLGSTSPKEAVNRGSGGGKALNIPDTNTSTLRKLWCILEELLGTELEYVRSLGYVLTHYLPLLARPDVPQDLRGQRGRIFGNLEKIHNFHCHYFLQELEVCRAEPLKVGRCFLRHRESFGLYALYSKNKPQSDALIQHHKYFKRKQMELGDSMDLSSYLLKPVQRISKYGLLLQEMLEECGPDHGLERQEIQAATEVVRFQLRHGNDLLTMDAIQDCDVNLKEQGQLIRQDEFYVTFRKKRTLRRVFLFQELILFTKTKKTLRGDEVYVCKQSFKTCDIGVTRSCGDSGLCFEIWFRRRQAQHTYMLQAERQDVKQAWTIDLEQILWKQALKNRELWRQERVFMGVGSKSFMDIQTSEATIHDKSIFCLLTGRGITLSLFDIDLQLEKNNADHHTDVFCKDRLIVRRGQPFTINLSMKSDVSKLSVATLIAETGLHPSVSSGTRVSMDVNGEPQSSGWSAALSQHGKDISLTVCASPKAPIGKYRLILSEPSFESGILNVCLKILNKSLQYKKDPDKDVSQRGDPMYVTRVLSAMINSNDDSGVLAGKWGECYSGGVAPTSWTGSVEILRQWSDCNCASVRYGQCWVFAGVGCTVKWFLLASGSSTGRVITNFESAHDSNGDLKIESYVNENGQRVKESVWNYHCWLESWMKRPDLKPGYDGVMCCGPVPVKAIKGGDLTCKYDAAFVYAEVNADHIVKCRLTDGRAVDIVDKVQIGQKISTKRIGLDDREDITHLYKHREGSELERVSYRNAQVCQDFDLSIECPQRIKKGSDFNLHVLVANKSSTVKMICLLLSSGGMLHNGQPIAKGFRSHMEQHSLKPGKVLRVPMEHTYSSYSALLCTGCQLLVTAQLTDIGRCGRMMEKRVVILEDPEITIQILRQPRVGQQSCAKLSMRNPVPEVLGKCRFTIEGPNLTHGETLSARLYLQFSCFSTEFFLVLSHLYKLGPQRCCLDPDSKCGAWKRGQGEDLLQTHPKWSTQADGGFVQQKAGPCQSIHKS
ncbi:hypothetical protein P4O66_020947, partial [Electrophorus voltai]